MSEKISPEDEAVAQQIMREHFPNDWMDQKHLTAAIASALQRKGSAGEEAADLEIRRLQDGIRDHLISLGAPDGLIDGAGCDSGDPLDFTKAEITQAFNYFEDEHAAALRAEYQRGRDDRQFALTRQPSYPFSIASLRLGQGEAESSTGCEFCDHPSAFFPSAIEDKKGVWIHRGRDNEAEICTARVKGVDYG